MASQSVPVVSQDEARASVSAAEAILLVERSYRDYGKHREVLSVPPAVYLPPLPETAELRLKGALAPSAGVAGFRMIANRKDPAGPRQTVAQCWVVDARSGELLGIVDETKLYRLRTAATGVVAAGWLAPAKVGRIAVIGTGRIADELPALLAGRFGSPPIVVAARSAASAESFVSRHGATLPLQAAATTEEALEGADLVIAITASHAPVIAARHLRPGMTIIGLGGGPEMAADVLDKLDRLVVDDVDYASTIGSVKGWLDQGIGLERIKARLSADIGEVALGFPGRENDGQTVIAVIQGMASCDVAFAGAVLRRIHGP